MKRTFLLIIILSLIVTSCYISAITEYELTIVDNGQYDGDRTYRIVTIAGPDGFDYFYYNASSDSVSNPTSDSKKYAPNEYKGVDSNTYTGMLIKEGQTVKAIGYKNANGNVCSSFIAEITLPVSKWDIMIVDNGPYSEDETKHIVTITDSSWSGSIYYDFGKNTDPTNFSTGYVAQKYEGINGKKYSGVLVSAGSVINAVSYKKIGNGTYSSNIARKDLNQWAISIVDNGPSLVDNSKRIVSIADSVYSSTDIYYTLDGTTPTSSSTKYVPQDYQGTDSKTYTGVLLPEATTVKTVADRTENGNVITSFVSEVTTDINQWEISIIDHGEAKDDNSKRIVSIIDNKWNGDIYFRTDGGEFYTWEHGGVGLVSYESLRYSPSKHEGLDGNLYEGVLVAEATEIKAISCVTENSKTRKSEKAESYVQINNWDIEMIDYGPLLQDSTKHIISIIDNKWNGDIYYSLNGEDPSLESYKFSPEEFVAKNSNIVSGILVAENAEMKAMSIITKNGITQASYVCDTVEAGYHWDIRIIDNGPAFSDIKMHIIEIVDDLEQGEIYYSLQDEEGQVSSFEKYLPTKILGSDSKEYEGILVSEGTTVCTYSSKTIGAPMCLSNRTEQLVLYRIGDRGIAGGFVFYDKGEYSDGWRYLEAAPNDLQKQYPFGSQYGHGQFTSKEIGTGKSNTEALVKFFGEISCAARACSDYVCNGFDDWFLPSLEELALMYNNLDHKKTNFADVRYWSSSQHTSADGSGDILSYSTSDWTFDFSLGKKELYWRDSSLNVRPVRAF